MSSVVTVGSKGCTWAATASTRAAIFAMCAVSVTVWAVTGATHTGVVTICAVIAIVWATA